MSDNEVISKWLRKGWDKLNDSIHHNCGPYRIGGDIFTLNQAWTPELYQRIEDEELANMMVTFMDSSVTVTRNMPTLKALAFKFLRASPAQKAAALAQAIRESE